MPRERKHLQIADIWIDVSVREVHSTQAEVTHFPVEEGADISDHVRLMPEQLQIEGLVSNQPVELPGSHTQGAVLDPSGFTVEGEPTLGALGLVPMANQVNTLVRTFGGPDRRNKVQLQVTGTKFSKEFDRVTQVEAALRAVVRARQPVQIVTGLRVYEAVVLIDLSIMREAANSGRLQFGCTGEVIRVVKSGTAAATGAPDPVAPRGKPKVDKGNQTTKAEEPPRSTLKKLINAARGGEGLF